MKTIMIQDTLDPREGIMNHYPRAANIPLLLNNTFPNHGGSLASSLPETSDRHCAPIAGCSVISRPLFSAGGNMIKEGFTYVLPIIIVFLLITSFPISARVTGSAGIVAPGATLKKVADGFRYAEGPAWSPDGKLYFTDRPSSRILVWTAEEGVAVFRTDPDGANGLAFTRRP